MIYGDGSKPISINFNGMNDEHPFTSCFVVH